VFEARLVASFDQHGEEGMSDKQTDGYEKPTVEEIDVGDYPIDTAAGIISGLD